MLLTCWSVKGGSGTTVVAAAFASLLARRSPHGALLVDAGGDATTVLGLPDPNGPGLAEWLAAPDDVGADALARIEVDAGHGLRVLHRSAAGAGEAVVAPAAGPEAAERLVTATRERGLPTVVDAGPPSALSVELAAMATVSLLVVRPCYLALKRALAFPVRPSGVVVVDETRRSLRPEDVEEVLGVPVRAVVPWDPAIARCVDAGLLGRRIPRALASALRNAA